MSHFFFFTQWSQTVSVGSSSSWPQDFLLLPISYFCSTFIEDFNIFISFNWHISYITAFLWGVKALSVLFVIAKILKAILEVNG